MIQALINGKLYGQPETKTSAGGKVYVIAKARVAQPDGESMFCNIVGFNQRVQEQLLALDDGSAVAMAGTLKVGVWQPEGKDARVNLSMICDELLTVHHIKRRERSMQQERQEPRVSQRQVHAQHAAQQPLSGSLADMPNDLPY